MPTYYFDVYDGLDLPDTVGTELSNLDAAKVEAIRLAGDLISDGARRMVDVQDWRLEVTDAVGMIFFTMYFVVSVSPAARGGMVATEIPYSRMR